MATPLGRTPLAGRVVLALAAVVGVLFSAVPAQAAPATSAEAAELVAARGHELEAVTEQFNEARETLTAQQAAAQAAAAQLEQATAALATAQAQVRGIARSAWTGEGLSSFQALMTSDSADDFVDRMSTLQLVAGHQNGILEAAAGANVAAAQAQATAQDAAVQAQATYDKVAAQQADLQKQVAEYQAVYDRLSAQERQAVAATPGRASRSAEREPVAASGPVVASSDAAQTAIDVAMAQRGKPYVWARLRAGVLRLLGTDRLRLQGGRDQPAALQRAAVTHGSGGLARRPPARRPGLLLQPGEPRGHLHRQRSDGPRAHLR